MQRISKPSALKLPMKSFQIDLESSEKVEIVGSKYHVVEPRLCSLRNVNMISSVGR